ncbi:MAG TPA: ARMT1-like domain-containing protein [Thermoleophilia bacterium]|nr:ARMT1-like domain-containing protein [Thermoleophilia bacterium]
MKEFRKAIAGARSILFLADNCGEIVLDRLLIEQMPRDRLTIAVRGAAVLNDATLDDARVAGLDTLAPVIDNGSDAPATLLADCARDFRRIFREAEVIIAKGQGDYESLSDVDGHFFFLFKVKCPVVARHAGLPLNAHALLRSPTGPCPPT